MCGDVAAQEWESNIFNNVRIFVKKEIISTAKKSRLSRKKIITIKRLSGRERDECGRRIG